MEGRTLSHYRVLTHLGGGGMGVVYKAEDTRLKRPVALKFLPPDLTRDSDARERFVQEAQAASLLDHRDGRVKIVDFGIAKLMDHTGPTRTGTTVGTAAYMAPEQVKGGAVDRRSDVWAVGVVL